MTVGDGGGPTPACGGGKAGVTGCSWALDASDLLSRPSAGYRVPGLVTGMWAAVGATGHIHGSAIQLSPQADGHCQLHDGPRRARTISSRSSRISVRRNRTGIAWRWYSTP